MTSTFLHRLTPVHSLVLVGLTWFSAITTATPAHAQPGDGSTAPPATLGSAKEAGLAFDKARELMDLGQFDKACLLFKKSQELDASPGTLLNIANCSERERDLLEALKLFELARSSAAQHPRIADRPRWIEAADTRIARLRKRIPTLTLVASATEGSQVQLNDQVVQPSAEAIALNPGLQVLTVSADGYLSNRQELNVEEGKHLVVSLPQLVATPAMTPLPTPSEPAAPIGTPTPEPSLSLSPPPTGLTPLTADTQSSYGAAPMWLMASGAAVLGVGVGTGLLALSYKNEVQELCDANRVCPDSFEDPKSKGETMALTTDILYGVGGVLAGVGLALYFLEPSDSTEQSAEAFSGSLTTTCGVTTCGFIATGSF